MFDSASPKKTKSKKKVQIMADSGDGTVPNSQPKCSPTTITDAPITDPGSSVKV